MVALVAGYDVSTRLAKAGLNLNALAPWGF